MSRLGSKLPITLLTAVLAAGIVGCDSGTDITARKWRQDLEVVETTLRINHPNAWDRTPRDVWQADYDQLYRDLPGLTETQATVRLMQLVASLNDGHTRLRPNPEREDMHELFPLRTYRFTDGIHVISTTKEHEDLLGAKVARIGEYDAEEALMLAATVTSWDNDFTRYDRGPRMLMLPGVLEGLGIIPTVDELPLEVVTRDGRRRKVTIPNSGSHSMLVEDRRWYNQSFGFPGPDVVVAREGGGAEPSLAYRNRRRFYWFEYVPADRLLYFQFNVVHNAPDDGGPVERLHDFFQRMFTFIDEHEVDKFVIDLRYNGGGNNRLIRPLIHGIIRRDGINRTGHLFTVLGRSTFSAAMSLAGALEEHTNTLFVGEPSGSTPNQYGDSRSTTLPNSGLVLRVSSVWWMNTNALDNRQVLPPHIAAQWSSRDFLTRQDPALDKILALEEYVDPQDVFLQAQDVFLQALEEGDFASAKSAYRQYKRDVPDDWRDTKGIMNSLGYQLLEAGKVDEAIVVFELNVETYPGYASGWDSLGEGYMVKGDYPTAIHHYEKSLQLDPKNGNATDMIHRMKREM